MEGKRGKYRIMLLDDIKASVILEYIKRRAMNKECLRNYMNRTNSREEY